MTKKLLLLTLLFSFNFITSQQKSIDTSYEDYFENTREVPFLHINKTSFLSGEEVWFKAYILEQNSGKLHPTSSNLYVSIFDAKGALKDQKLIHIKEGMGRGNIYLDSTYNQPHYFIKASTNWMKNFKEDNAFVQKFKIITNRKKDTKVAQNLNENNFFDFQVFPEGGHYLLEAENSLGILIKDANGKGVVAKEIVLKDKKGKTVSSSATNFLGLGHLSFVYDKQEQYTLQATLSNGSVIEKTIPKADGKGVVLRVENPNTSYVSVSLVTNKETLPQLLNKSYTLLFHNTTSFYGQKVQFKKNQDIQSVIINKNKLPNGTNIVTVFDDQNQPILERVFFNYNSDLFASVDHSVTKMKYDSIATTFTNKLDEKLYLSASYLPEQSKAYNPENNIYSTFLLKPYIKGQVQNPDYFFTDVSRKKLKDLDLLLITQGWSKYNWHNIFNKPPTTNFNFENGIDITAKMNNELGKGQSVLMYSKDNNLVRVFDNGSNPLQINNSFIKKNSTVDFALMSNGNLFKTAPAMSYSNSKIYESIDLKQFPEKITNELEISSFKSLPKDIEVLDEVIVKNNKRTFENRAHGWSTWLTGIKTENLIIPSGETLLEFLAFKRYNIIRSGAGELAILPRAGAGGFGNNYSPLNPEFIQRRSVQVFLDDYDITNSLNQLESINTNMVKELFYGRLPANLGEIIYIYLYTPQEYTTKNSETLKLKIPIGFAQEKEYYTPKYPSFVDETYLNYGAVFWEPNISVDANTSFDVKSPANLQDNILVRLEGISESGKLISKKFVLN